MCVNDINSTNRSLGGLNMKCERCGALPKGKWDIHDYCANCSKNLCPDCMNKGCCGKKPADSGMKEDHSDDDEE